MCGRFSQKTDAARLAEFFEMDADWPEWVDHNNIAPTQQVVAVRCNPVTQKRELVALYWGLIPHWSKDRSIGAKLFNARSETVVEKPSFRDAFRQRRCIVPADCFFEWKKVGKLKTPICVQSRQSEPLALAGLWESWQDPNNGIVESCTILTTTPSELLKPIHNRMPVILSRNGWQEWLTQSSDLTHLHKLCVPCPAENLMAYEVSRSINNLRNDEPATSNEPILSKKSAGKPSSDKNGQGRLF